MLTLMKLRNTRRVDAWRRVSSDGELRAIAAAGAGFVIDPFNRRWHHASCPRIAAMADSEPKHFAETSVGLEAFLAQRAAAHGTALPIQPCRRCAGGASAIGAALIPGAGADRPVVAGRDQFCCLIRVVGSAVRQTWLKVAAGFEVWSTDYVPYQVRTGSNAARLRQVISDAIRELPAPRGRILSAAYAGPRLAGTDVENLLIYNINQGFSAFAAGVRFEDLGTYAPPDPDGAGRIYYYRYRLDSPGGPFPLGRRRLADLPGSRGRGPGRRGAAVAQGVARVSPGPAGAGPGQPAM